MNKMNNASPKNATNPWKNLLKANPSVCEYQPSVFSCNPSNKPFIGRNIPNNKLQHSARWIYGFTLIELVVTVAVAAILVMVAVPNFRIFVQNSRITTQANDFISDLSFARSEAVRSGASASMCTSTTGAICDGGGNWSSGRLVWTDANGNGVLDPGEARRFREQLAGANTLNVDVAAADPLTFNNRGSQIGAVAGVTITFRLCDDRGVAFGRNVVINPLGQTRVSGPPATACP